MECKHAYIKENINYVLCDCDGKPEKYDLKNITPIMCNYQRFCPKVNQCALLPTWRECKKLHQNQEKKPEKVEIPEEIPEEVIVDTVVVETEDVEPVEEEEKEQEAPVEEIPEAKPKSKKKK